MPDVDFHGKYHHSYRQHRRYSRPSQKEETFYRRRGPLNPETGCPWGMSPMCREDFLKAQAAKNTFEASHGTVKKLAPRKLLTFEELSSMNNDDVLMTEIYSGGAFSQYQTRLPFDEDKKEVPRRKFPTTIRRRNIGMTTTEVEDRVIPPFVLLAIRCDIGAGDSLDKKQLTNENGRKRKRCDLDDLDVIMTSKQPRRVTFSEVVDVEYFYKSQIIGTQPPKTNDKRRRVWRRKSEVKKVTPRSLTRLDESVLDLTS